MSAWERHPAWSPLFNRQPSAVDFLSNEAADRIVATRAREGWLTALAPRVADIESPSEAAAALAELRAFGAMLEAGLEVTPLAPNGAPTPDFHADAGDGKVLVEVHAKHEHGDETLRRQAVARGEEVPGVERSTSSVGEATVTFTTMVLHPGGKPNPANPHDSVQANVISKLCNAKGKETQMSSDIPGVLWLDLSYFDPMSESLLNQAQPLLSGHGIMSGAIWHAFYGWKGAPIIEGHRARPPMAHDGRFRRSGKEKSGLAAVIVTVEKGLVLLENPWTDRALPDLFRRSCLNLPWFHIGHSVANWTPDEAEKLVGVQRARIEALAR
jgi:hypothetical protein